ncbi:DUF2953 domain-containing protein [Halanaerobacter jeridensis]|uniref:DUF2953 family protein n=1 Tax=Halanaerobacter jeridensis TaxID=706427 RepID=A0A939BLZ8_9FIRM|nr:DUF2953 domain-containing protein [Halanaerobacter jeridensis]MBM7555305.1 hypothetical protein [Halanaerobacter jeridensis]
MKIYLLFVIIFIILLYFIPIQLAFDYQRKNDKDDLTMQLKIFFLKYNFKLSFIDFKRLFSFPTSELKGTFSSLFSETNIEFKEEISEEELKELKHAIKVIKRIISRFELIFLLTHNCALFSWRSSFGCQNPAHTGMMTGLLWSVKSSLISILQTKLEFKELPIIDVVPNFTKEQSLMVEFKGIFTFRLGKLILIAVTIMCFELKRRVKEKWKNTQLLS